MMNPNEDLIGNFQFLQGKVLRDCSDWHSNTSFNPNANHNELVLSHKLPQMNYL